MSANERRIKHALMELSDKTEQERLWLASEGEFSSFIEAVEELYSDSGLSYDLEKDGSQYGSNVDALFIQLGEELDRIDHTSNPRLIICDPVMERVRRLANRILVLIS